MRITRGGLCLRSVVSVFDSDLPNSKEEIRFSPPEERCRRGPRRARVCVRVQGWACEVWGRLGSGRVDWGQVDRGGRKWGGQYLVHAHIDALEDRRRRDLDPAAPDAAR